nr:PREDICTED: laminin subunit gamma-3 [Lepisosteus oculatus]
MGKAVFWLLLLTLPPRLVSGGMDSCYDTHGAPHRCLPKFENAAFNKTVLVSNVCGSPPEDFCMQAGSTKSCHHCDSMDPLQHHNATYLTDFHSEEEPSWWQSQSMFYGIQYPTSVNLTLHLGKAYEITYIRLKFHTSRPESFAIYKRTQEGGPWLPYQHYSASCRKTYAQSNQGYIRPGEDERTATCTDEFSDISPLTGGNVAFSTLEGRPSAYNFDQSPVLQEWVTATDLLISLDRLNTFGDEFFKDPKVLRSYYYAISDFSVGGRCKCNGHASECVRNEAGRLVCDCQHNTAGPDCERCQPFYHDRPWARATADSANECLPCNCSGRAEECYFDAELYRRTGHGSHCSNCRDNTDGPNCEKCKDNFYRSSPQDVCLPCNCSVLGSSSLQCGGDGHCVCKRSVAGEKCDSCQPGYHSLTAAGCRPCHCQPSGSVGFCGSQDGQCRCKAHVEGYSCDRCKPGSFNLDSQNPDGCLNCFCFGHSAVCTSASHYSAINITSDFTEDTEGWIGEFSNGLESSLIWKEGEVYLLPYSEKDSGFYKAPEMFLGNRQLSYGQPLSFTFQAESVELLPQEVKVILQGSGMEVTTHLFPVAGQKLSLIPQCTFVFRLHEKEERQRPSLSSSDFRHLLSNLTAIKISNAGGQNYTAQLSGVTLVTAAPGPSPSAPWVEECTCPQGYMGQFCEDCTPGYKREIPNGGPFVRCIPCTCNQHGICDPETGVCQCTDNTTGPACDSCLHGFYGNPLIGSSSDCQPCPCPSQSGCTQIPATQEVVCTECPPGQRGRRCELCDDGFYGDPLGAYGHARRCLPCECHGNVDPNAVGVCDPVAGRCLKCLHHAEGDHCERCREGYYGNAQAAHPGDKCKPCSCSPAGSLGSPPGCDPQTGQCPCLSRVTGRDCSRCDTGSFNLQPGAGCERCECSPVGAVSPACHPVSGRCTCRPGVEGARCDSCRDGFFGFSSRGCRACNCDPMGSVTMQCHGNGTCVCREGFVGYKCDQCELNYFHNRGSHQCEECPACYSLVRDEAAKLKETLQALENLLEKYDCRYRRGPEYYPIQREHSWTNSLEGLLAMQDARDAFVNEFAQLERSAEQVQKRLGTVSLILNCSSQETDKPCSALSDTTSLMSTAQRQLQQAKQMLDTMVIPVEMPTGPNQWTALVNESQVLALSQMEAAGLIESAAKGAFMASDQTFSRLLTFLEENSTEAYIRTLTEQYLQMHQSKYNLTISVNETLTEAKKTHISVRRTNAEITDAFLKFTTFQKELMSEPNFNVTDLQAEEILAVVLSNKTAESDKLIQSKDEQISKILLELQPHLESIEKDMETIQHYDQLTPRATESKSVALSSVVKGKEVEAEASALLKELEVMKKSWPRKTAQTKASMKKAKIVKEKILEDSKKKTKQGERMLRYAVDNSTLANSTAREAQGIASEASKVAKDTLSQTRKAQNESLLLNSTVDAVLHELADQEGRTSQLKREIGEMEEIANTVDGMKENIQTAKHALESYSLMLSELLQEIDEDKANERYDSLLNETRSQLGVLRRGLESTSLDLKIQGLRAAAQEQESQLEEVRKNIEDILEEKRGLEDIILNLPEGCTDRPKTGDL